MALQTVSAAVAEAESGPPLLWILGWARQVDRTALHEHLGPPLHVETDSTRTFGGDEDWWLYEAEAGEVLGVCLRVPYGDAVLYSSIESMQRAPELADALSPWPVEIFEKPYAR